jgi:hypothetical protein
VRSIVLRIGVLVAALAPLAGCATLSAVDRGYGDALAAIEPNPREAKLARKLSMQELKWAPRGWREYEIGRRFEEGIGVDRNLNCAAYWYRLASVSAYEQIDFNPAWGVNPPTVTHVGLPWARLALRRIGRADDDAVPSIDTQTCQGVA